MNKNYINKIFNEDCITGMKKIPDGKINLVLTDPPFGIDFKRERGNYNRKKGNVLEGYNDVQIADYDKFTSDWIKEAARVLKGSGSMYIFSGWNNLEAVLRNIRINGLITVNHIIWKYQFGVYTQKKFVTAHYHLLFVIKNYSQYKFYNHQRFRQNERDEQNRSKRYADMEDVWNIPKEYWTGQKKTPTKLPGAIIEKILDYSSKPGDLVLDPFLGSGQTAVIAKQMKRKYCGFEIIKEYYDFAKSRL